MNLPEAEKPLDDLNRRDFLRGASFGSLMVMMGGIPLHAQEKPGAAPADTGFDATGLPLNCAVIGCGVWGREILHTLAVMPNAPVVAICDTYAGFLRRASEITPKAAQFKDYRQVLELKEVQGVIVATPSHQHREIVEAALKAGKHVYCEAPLAASIEDARAIAQAAKAAVKLNFQAGLQARSDPWRHYIVSKFLRVGAVGKNLSARSQWHARDSWRRTAQNPEREKELNWRLRRDVSPGIIGEAGVHQLDVMNWFLNERPTAVTGFGNILAWSDGRDVPDTVQAVLEYPDQVNYLYDGTLGSSFEAECDTLFGTYATVMMRGTKGWLFKESDSPLLGWEIYASKEQFHTETGIVLSMNATKSVKPKSAEDAAYSESPLHFALAAFLKNSNIVGTGAKNFSDTYGADTSDGLPEYMATLAKDRAAAAGFEEGFEATVCALKANEAIVQGGKIVLKKEWFEI